MPSLACCHHDLTLVKRKRMNEWMKDYSSYKPTTESFPMTSQHYYHTTTGTDFSSSLRMSARELMVALS